MDDFLDLSLLGRRPGVKALVGEVYLERKTIHLDSKRGARESIEESYWIVRKVEGERITINLLDINDEPSRHMEEVNRREFDARFVHQPGYFETLKTPQQRLINKVLDLADEHYRDQEFNSAEYEYANALKIDEKSIRANFGLGMTYLAQDEYEQARKIFKRLADLEGVNDPVHKHLFNEFGIDLRKVGLYDESLEHYHRALILANDDEHLWFNIARAVHEAGHPEEAVRLMNKALLINPDFVEAKRYLIRYLKVDREGTATPGLIDDQLDIPSDNIPPISPSDDASAGQTPPPIQPLKDTSVVHGTPDPKDKGFFVSIEGRKKPV